MSSQLLVNGGILLGGLAVLYIGSELLLRAAIALSIRGGISRAVIGLTVVALGTSFPELFISVISVLDGKPALALGNIFGSNNINIGLILGLSMCIGIISYSYGTLKRNILLLFVVFMALPLCIIRFDEAGMFSITIERWFGVVLLAVISLYYAWEVVRIRQERTERMVGNGGLRAHPTVSTAVDEQQAIVGTEATQEAATAQPVNNAARRRRFELKHQHIVVLLLCVAAGGGLLYLGSGWLVSSAATIASLLGLSERIIALTIVAHGTSAPEIFASFSALRKSEGEIIIGNILGSNIVNTMVVLGVVGALRPITLHNSEHYWWDITAMIILTLLMLVLLRHGKHLHKTKRWKGLVLVCCYIGYYSGVLLWR